nr:ORF3 [Torque teno Leptonychotes weddellii virus 2]WCS66071.1 ORF3 [Torque teno Leptonychotes weddellii virus 2]
MDSKKDRTDQCFSNTNSFLSSLESLSTDPYQLQLVQTSSPKLHRQKLSMAERYRLAPYSKDDHQAPQTSYRETSTQTASLQTKLWQELLKIVQEDSQPCWCQKESDSDSEDGTDSGASIISLETRNGGRGEPRGGRPPPPLLSHRESPAASSFNHLHILPQINRECGTKFKCVVLWLAREILGGAGRSLGGATTLSWFLFFMIIGS